MLKRFGFILAVIIVVAFYALSVSELAAKPVPTRCTAAAFRPFAAKVWTAPWQRGAPKPATIQAKLRRVACAPPGHRGAMIRTWNRKRASYYARRGHCLSGRVFAGRVSEFSGGQTADGVHVATEPGIALRSSATLGETFRLRTNAGTDYVTQTDWGPADWTGRTIDITSAQMAQMGWVETDSWGEAKMIPGDCL